MYLKSLTMKGFKSFADTTTLAFEPGVNVVVGPNGSGKSNVVDAIAWVLGMQSPTVVRAQKMDDIVFAGSAARRSLGRAEVSLVIDNHSGLLPIDFTEVTICRTLFRSGQSEYTLNDVSCRLRDITELLSDAGIGQTQHTIVSQGQIEETLNAGPMALRMILEEAAGMLKHRRRREQAERQIVDVEANLTRGSDLLREVRRQIKPLKQQAEAAQQHADTLAALTALQQYLAGREIAELTERRREAAEQLRQVTEAEERLSRQIAPLDEEIAGLEQQIAESGQGDAAEDTSQLEAQRSNARERIATLRERLAQMDASDTAKSAAAAIASYEAEVSQLQAELGTSSDEHAKLAEETAQLDAVEEEIERVLGIVGGGNADWDDGVSSSSTDEFQTGGASDASESFAQQATDQQAADQQSQDTGQQQSALAATNARRRQIEGRLHAARNAMAEAEADRRHYASRAEALAATIAQARARSGAEELAEFEGVLGTLLELVIVEAGWELAFEAAVEEAVAAVVIADSERAREALRHLKSRGTPGAILAGGISAPVLRRFPADLAPLRPHVRSESAEVNTLLDILLADVVVKENHEDAMEAALENPDLCVVTRSGDRFGKAGSWQIGAQRTGASLAAWEEARRNERAASDQRDACRKETEELEAALSKAEEAVRRRGRIEVRASALEERQQMLRAQLSDRQQQLEAQQEKSAQAAAEQQELERQKHITTTLLEGLEATVAEFDEELEAARERRNQQGSQVRKLLDDLQSRRASRQAAAQELAECGRESLRLSNENTEATVRLENATASLRRDMHLEPREAMDLEEPELPEGVTAAVRAEQLHEELRVIGTVNPLALQEYDALKEREEFLESQIGDIRASRNKLRNVIGAANAEIANEFLLAFEDVSETFSALFQKLFAGGSGKLLLSHPNDLLETGVEISAQPSDKKVSRLSLLSGGERSLVALAFLFAVFMSRPSPFYVLDEVDAALDQINIARYLGVMDEFRQGSQLVIVTHQRLTVERADCLWGVSMPSGGVSKVVSQRVAV